MNGEIVLPSGQLRDGRRTDYPEVHDSEMELDTQDLFTHFSDRGRLLRAGYLACLDFLGFLQHRARLRSACRLTLPEALQLYTDIMECTAESEDEVESGDESEESPAERGLTEEQFEALLQALEVRMSRRTAHFKPCSAALAGSECVERLLRRSASNSLSPRRSRSPRHPQTAPSSAASWEGTSFAFQTGMQLKDLPAAEAGR